MAMKKAQIKMTENIMIIFIFFILLVFGMIFYVRIHTSNLEKEMHKLAGEEAVNIALKVSHLPEAICSESNDIKKNCFDILKLDTAEEVIIDNKGDYYDLLKYSEVRIEQIYPVRKTWVLYNNSGNKTGGIHPPALIPINLHDPISDKYAFGVLEVAVWT